MPNTNWKRLNSQQLGKYAEHYAFMEFLSYGLDIYPTSVDDHGVDLVIKDKKKRYWDVQIKSLFKSKYAFMQPKVMEDENGDLKKNFLVCLLLFKDGEMPKIYLFKPTVWVDPVGVFRRPDYEYGIQISGKNQSQLDQYEFDKAVQDLL